MGVSGTGKTTVARGVSSDLSLVFIEGDDFHPPENRAKMAAGIPLTDEDRLPWLRSIRAKIDSYDDTTGVVLACSALKRSYRRLLYAGLQKVLLVYLDGSHGLLRSRMEGRAGHFMPVTLLRSQLDTLERPSTEEMNEEALRERSQRGGDGEGVDRWLLVVSVDQPVKEEISQVVAFVRGKNLGLVF